MNKAYINQTVADLIEEAKANNVTRMAQMMWLYGHIDEQFLVDNNTSMTEITKALENGYVVVTIYKEKDVVKAVSNGKLMDVVGMDRDMVLCKYDNDTTNFGVFYQDQIILVIEAAGRKDL